MTRGCRARQRRTRPGTPTAGTRWALGTVTTIVRTPGIRAARCGTRQRTGKDLADPGCGDPDLEIGS
jgi:hypothetical protein